MQLHSKSYLQNILINFLALWPLSWQKIQFGCQKTQNLMPSWNSLKKYQKGLLKER
jgi:hypothetical protein